MAITVNWITKVVFIPKGEASISTVVSVSPEIYEYDLDLLRLEIKAIEASEEGMAFLDIHFHTPPFTIGNVQLARVVGIINGYTLEFEDGQYQVNYVGANTDFSEAINRVINQVSVTPQNSAGLITTASTIQLISSAVWETEQASHVVSATMGFILNQYTYQNKIWVDPLNSTGNASSGQVAGINGTPTKPCTTVADAKAIADAMNISTYHVLSTTVLDRDHPRWEFQGSRDVLIDPAGFDITGGEFKGLCLAGDFGGYAISASQAALGDNLGGATASGIVGDFVFCVLNEVGVVLASGATIIADGHSSVAGNTRPTVDFAGVTGAELSLRGYSGGLEVLNMTSPSNISTVEFIAGRLTVGPSNTAGTISARGVATLQDTSTGTVIDTAALINKVDITSEVWEESVVNHTASGTVGRLVSGLDYDGRVWLDTVNGVPGSVLNVNGTRTNPVNSIADCDVIRSLTGFNGVHIRGSVVLTSPQLGTVWDNTESQAFIDINGQDITNSSFMRCTLSGNTAGSTGLFMDKCTTIDLQNWQGTAVNSSIAGTTTLVSGGTGVTSFTECVASSITPVIDIQGSPLTSLTFARYTGRLEIRNMINSGFVSSINLDSGQVIYGPTNTDGVLVLFGQGSGLNTGAGVGLTVLDSSLFNSESVSDTVWDELLSEHTVVGSTGEAQAAQGDIGAAVLDALLTGHFLPGSVGEALTLIKGLVQSNYMIDSTSFNDGGLMTGARLRIFNTGAEVLSATDGGDGQGEVAAYTVVSVPETTNGLDLKYYKVSRD